MDTIAQMSVQLRELFGSQAQALGRETGFIQRERELSASAFALTVVFGWLQEPAISLAGLTQVLGRLGEHISEPGLWKRFTPQAASFLYALLERATTVVIQQDIQERTLLQRFAAVVVEDSSSVSLPAALASIWLGCGGSLGSTSSAVKLHVRWDVLRGRLEGPRLTNGRQSDKRSPFDVEDLPSGCLYLADLGYYSAARLARLSRRGQHKRYFISRYQSRTAVCDRHRRRLDLHALVPQAVGQRVERLVVLAQERLVVRLIMERVPAEVAEQRRQRMREAAQDQGREPEAETLWLADWTIVLTNAPTRLLSGEEVLILMRLRWQIERLFWLWKVDGGIDAWHSQNPWHILCELYAKLLGMVIQQWLLTLGCWQDPHRSLSKAAQVVRREAGRLMVALAEGTAESVIASIRECMQSGCRLNRRRTAPNTSQFLTGMPLVWPQPRPTVRKKRQAGSRRGPVGKGWRPTRIRAPALS